MFRWNSHRKSWGVVSALVLWMMPLATPARSNDTAQAHIDAARRFYDELEYERAMEALDRAQRRARTPEENASILLHEGVILSEMGRPEEASAAFRAALSMKLDASLPLLVSPKIQRLFEAARREVERDLAQASAKPGPTSPPVPPAAQGKGAPPSPVAPAGKEKPVAAATRSSPQPAAPAKEPERKPAATAAAKPAPVPASAKKLSPRDELLKRITENEARLREKNDPELTGPGLARLKEIRYQVLTAMSGDHRTHAAVKLDRWESRFLPPPEPPAPAVVEAPAPAPPPAQPPPPPSGPTRSIDRKALSERISRAEAQLRQKAPSPPPAAITELRDIRRRVASAATVEHRRNAEARLDRWERRFLSAP